jgi:hypothetical protein
MASYERSGIAIGKNHEIHEIHEKRKDRKMEDRKMKDRKMRTGTKN